MMHGMGEPVRRNPLEAVVDRILARAGVHVVVATPLGLGKPNRLLNAIYRRIRADPSRQLTICTALSLDPPEPRGDLERRFIGPFLERQFGADYPRLDYVVDLKAGRLPLNVHVREFYFQSGAMLGNERAQRDYTSINYTQVARDLVDADVDAIVQLVAERGDGETARYSLSCNPDVTLDLLDALAAHGKRKPLLVGVVHPDLAFLGGDAELGAGDFDLIVHDIDPPQPLFALPRDPIEPVEHAIGLHASSLIHDDGTLQLGIGALSDAIVYACLLRHRRNAEYRAALAALRGYNPASDPLIVRWGGLTPFRRGLYGASEMLTDGFMHLREGGVLKRNVYDDVALQRALDAHLIAERYAPGDAHKWRAAGVLPARLDAAAFARLAALGLMPEGAAWQRGRIVLADGATIGPGLDAADQLDALDRACAGGRLHGGHYLKGAFYLGSRMFHAWLAGLEGADHAGLVMNRVSDVNQLYGGRETIDATQRRHARFFNNCMMATLLGAAVSDALEDGSVVSGVGGQYNFVSMAQALDDGRSLLLLRSTRAHGRRVESNIRWNYGYTTIPRHLRDLYVTEYGVADLRGKSDEACVRAMLAISDARFVDGLAAEAIRAHKLPRDFRVPDEWRRNTPQYVAETFVPFRARGLFGEFPFGSDFSDVELRLLPAMRWLRQETRNGMRGWLHLAQAALAPGEPDADTAVNLERMQLAAPRGIRERLLARLVRGALARSRAAESTGTQES
jgi:acyl-CoA hydrolase